MKIPVVKEILSANDQIAVETRAILEAHNILPLNLMASPGAGKTTLILATLDRLPESIHTGVIEGDLASSIDADTMAARGVPVVQINTGGGCHLAYSTPLGWEYWEQMQANGMRLVGQWGQLPSDVVDPNSPVAVVIAGYGLVYPDEMVGQPLNVISPTEGLIAGEYVAAIATEAKHPNLARAFIEEVTLCQDTGLSFPG